MSGDPNFLDDPNFRICAVCGRVLSHVTDSQGVGWMHSPMDQLAEDHPAVPVKQDEVPMIGRCDFCSADYPANLIPARSFVLPFQTQHMSNGDWSACLACTALIEANQWSRLVDRALATFRHVRPPEHEEMVRHATAVMYRKLRANITGPPRPLPPRCWCGGEIGSREPGDKDGNGCLANIMHDWSAGRDRPE